jgi:hypothetical protein
MSNFQSNQIVLNNTEEKVKNIIINKGKTILTENPFFNDLENIMADDHFRTFYNKYFKDFSDVKIVTLYMKLYETIQIEYKEINNCEIDKELLAYMIKELMSDNNSRKHIIESFDNYMNNKNTKNKRFILDIFKNIKEIKNDNKKVE